MRDSKIDLLIANVDFYLKNGTENEIEPMIGDRGMSQIDVEILLNAWDRIESRVFPDDAHRLYCEEVNRRVEIAWTRYQRSVNL